jgi:bifunctional non-homologous end joining protein LigD
MTLREASRRPRAGKRAADVGPPQSGVKTKGPMKQKSATSDGRITHPERVVFEGATYSKGDVAGYYRSVAKWLLPELRDRPLSLVRCPGGSQGECFFQKHHADSLGEHVRAIALEQKSGSEQYLYVDSIEGVIDLVQMNTLEFHPWGARVDDPEKPDRLVFDLDPGDGVGWQAVVAGARDLRAKLKQAGLQSFVRLSGGKGLHVVVPIARGPSWDDVHAFCESFSGAMAAHAPERYVATMSKAKRPRRIFIDWLRNTRGATSVASWSLRARKGAPVAVPLRWEELGALKRPDAFDLAAAQQRASRLRKDPWEGFADLRQRLPASN